jgi:hypothetical protein
MVSFDVHGVSEVQAQPCKFPGFTVLKIFVTDDNGTAFQVSLYTQGDKPVELVQMPTEDYTKI